ncbi:hypothetical protein FKM82_000242 [Ascaphus truei]
MIRPEVADIALYPSSAQLHDSRGSEMCMKYHQTATAGKERVIRIHGAMLLETVTLWSIEEDSTAQLDAHSLPRHHLSRQRGISYSGEIHCRSLTTRPS